MSDRASILVLIAVTFLVACAKEWDQDRSLTFVVDTGCEAQVKEYFQSLPSDLWGVRFIPNGRKDGFFSDPELIVELSSNEAHGALEPVMNGALAKCEYSTKTVLNLRNEADLAKFLFMVRNTMKFNDAYIRLDDGNAVIFTRQGGTQP